MQSNNTWKLTHHVTKWMLFRRSRYFYEGRLSCFEHGIFWPTKIITAFQIHISGSSVYRYLLHTYIWMAYWVTHNITVLWRLSFSIISMKTFVICLLLPKYDRQVLVNREAFFFAVSFDNIISRCLWSMSYSLDSASVWWQFPCS